MNHKNSQFKKLQALWDKKLKESGFEDIEYRDKPDSQSLKGGFTVSRVRKHLDTKPTEEIRNHYINAEHFLNYYEFECEFDRLVWEDYANNVPIRKSISRLQALGHTAYNNKVLAVIKKYIKLMELERDKY